MPVRILAPTLLLSLCAIGANTSWSQADSQIPAAIPLQTRWADEVNPSAPLPDYPRPQLRRTRWINLNGQWDYSILPLDSVAPQKFDGKILVPFPVESVLSSVRKPLTDQQRLWYRRTFQSPKLRGGKRLLLHFGAVDWEAKVFVNGVNVGEHRGGYDAFTFDITEAVKPGAQNELVVSVFDATGGAQPKGKQNFRAFAKPKGIMYTPCSGIWQTVWLEVVPATHVRALQITPDVDAGLVRVKISASTDAPAATVELIAMKGRREVSRVVGKSGDVLVLPLKNPRLWTPDDPFLYDLKVKLGDDEVTSYFGLRKISLGKDAKGFTTMLLNGQPVFQAGPLDQGYWPDGNYTAPTDAALRFDIEQMKRLGFNMVRKHVKVEPDRWYYWCDKLGLLVWQDMPSGGAGKGANRDHEGEAVSLEATRQFETELTALIETHWNHPSIIMWVVFNEGWGQFDTARLTQMVKTLDPSRLVNSASGWADQKTGDVNDQHHYPNPTCPPPESDRAAVLGEFGGLGLPTPGHTWVEATWGYRGVTTPRALTRKHLDLWRAVWRLHETNGLCAAVYTQLTDVETECNGLLTYDRAITKVDVQQLARAHRGEIPPPPAFEIVVATSERELVAWRFTTAPPKVDWFKPGFDDSAWKQSDASFGATDFTNAAVRTEWNSDDLWLRREIILPKRKLNHPALRMFNGQETEVFINGVTALKVTGRSPGYDEFDLKPEIAKALKPGKNVVAVHCHRTRPGQFFDLGIVEEKSP